MGIGSLRRYHKPLTSTGAADKAAPVVGSGPTETPEEAKAAAEANAAKLAQEQQAQADAANADQTGAQSVNPIVQEAGGVEDNPANSIPPTIPAHAPGVESEAGAEHEEIEVGTPVTPGTPEGEQEQAEAIAADTKHGELERPNRGSSKQAWLDYTAADPGGVPEGYADLNRDQLAELYLGPR